MAAPALRVGLTGGIASGKSAVANLFAAKGIVVADADVAAREVVQPGQSALAEVAEAFGPDVLQADGQLDRAALRRHVFGNDDARKRLEAILHPRIRLALRATAEAARSPYVIVAIPLLAEGGGRAAYPWLDRILVVDVPRDVQVARVMHRDAIDRVLAERMLAAQADRRTRLAIADDVLVNVDTLAALDAEVDALDRRYRAMAAMRD
ncbi:dephospho-CoA kinase [Lysobacter helvus]|uniref:Dephospho-CoA kinase n=2 Tax=Lysobacteraceae TaxID=32033 RepID=A0ABM7Q3B7_9GAMM|nr:MULTISPECIES: dephospho-CoA kinase [Lysobacter]BCT91761.1 dephospho-CoA kinase [Lysobacter caseinilyticus]BCT94914.1 dephospho-CoA kinase [Lysobacter helvus]